MLILHSHYIVVLHNQHCHSHIQMYICIYITYIHSLFLLLQHSYTFIFLFMCMSVLFMSVLLFFTFVYVCFYFYIIWTWSWHSMWIAKKYFNCTGKLAFPHCAHDNKRFESLVLWDEDNELDWFWCSLVRWLWTVKTPFKMLATDVGRQCSNVIDITWGHIYFSTCEHFGWKFRSQCAITFTTSGVCYIRP